MYICGYKYLNSRLHANVTLCLPLESIKLLLKVYKMNISNADFNRP